MNSTKGYPYYSRLYPIFNREPMYFEENQHKCITFPIPIFKEMETSSEKTINKSFYFYEPINKYQNLSFTDIKDLSLEKEHFINIFLINKNQHKKPSTLDYSALYIKASILESTTKKCTKQTQ